MNRKQGKNGVTRVWPVVVMMAIWLEGSAVGGAEPATAGMSTNSAGKGAPPAGLNILYSGDSWHRSMPGMMPEIAKAAGITGQKVEWNGVLDKMKALLEDGKIDVLSWGRPGWSEGLSEMEHDKIIESGLKGNPNLRIYLQMAWAVHDGSGKKIETKDDYDNAKIAEVQATIDGTRKGVEAQADAINRKYGKRVVFLIPLGDAMTKVRGRIVDGTFPGVKRQSEVFSDAMPHPGPIAWALMAYCNYAAVYQRSPVGLTWGGGMTEEQREILQNIAWEAVSKYPYAGLATNDVPEASKNEVKAVPVAGVGATAVPEALQGWKAVQELPDDVVVTDYNAYIEQLPKAERPGVFDVKYYVDGKGGHAVAVLVNVGSVQWTHLLAYDKQNKRLTVSKHAQSK